MAANNSNCTKDGLGTASLGGWCWKAYDDANHASSGFTSDEPSSTQQNNDGYGNRDDRQVELGIVLGGGDHNQELHGKAEEEEEIELQQSDVDLIGEVATLHAEVRTDVLVNRPRKLVVQLPRNEDHQE